MGSWHLPSTVHGERARIAALLVPALVLYAIFSLETLRSRECARPSLGIQSLDDFETSQTSAPKLQQPSHYPLQLPECARSGARATTFLMIFMGHSGSSAIISELGSHSQVYFENGEPVDHFEFERNTTLALEWTKEFFERGIAKGKTPGFKLRPTHIQNEPAKWAALSRQFDTRIIWQYRENLFKKSVGEYTYRYLNDSSVVEGLRRPMSEEERCKIGVGCKFKVDNFDFFHYLLQDSVQSDVMISQAVHQILDGRSCVHALPYEKYLYDRPRAMRDVQRFLGLRHEMHPPLRHKATRDNLCEAVSNWNELCRNFYGCHAWRWQMDDHRNGCNCAFKSGPVQYCAVDYPVQKVPRRL